MSEPITERILDDDQVSRAFFEIPDGIDSESNFPFHHDVQANERAESVYWRKYAPALQDVHARGCELEPIKQLRSTTRYIGARTATAGAIQKIISGRGHTFTVFHYPENGDFAHAHIAIKPAEDKPSKKLRTNDIRELIGLLVQQFGGLDPHNCVRSTDLSTDPNISILGRPTGITDRP